MKKLIIATILLFAFIKEGNAFCRADTTLIYTFEYLSSVNKFLSGRIINTYDSRNNVLVAYTENYTVATDVWTPSNWRTNQYDANDSVIESVFDTWNTTTSNRVHFSKANYVYNNSGKVIDVLTYKWSSILNDWSKQERSITAYNSADKPTSIILQKGNPTGNVWVNFTRQSYSYNGNNQPLEYVFQDWNTALSTWGNTAFESYSYNVDGLRMLDSIKRWNTTSNVWYLNRISYYTYDVQQKLSSKLIREYNTTASSWVDIQRYLYSTNLYSDVLDEEYQEYNSSAMVWLNYTKMNYEFYSNGSLKESVRYRSAGTTSWLPDQWIQYTYNAQNQLIQRFVQEGDYPVSQWKPGLKVTYEYANNSLIAYDNYSTYASAVGAFTTHRRYEIQCTNINTSLSGIDAPSFTFYPQPITSGDFTIQTIKECGYSIQDMSGRVVQVGELHKGDNQIQLQSISFGVYFIKVDNQTQLLIIQ